MARREPNPIDVHVGSRVRMRRMLVGMSQEKLGEQLGLTFQQVQKYEKGANRIGASRLYQISQILDVPVQYFYDGLEPSGEGPKEGFSEESAAFDLSQLSSSEGIRLNKAYFSMKNTALRRRMLELMEEIAAADRER